MEMQAMVNDNTKSSAAARWSDELKKAGHHVFAAGLQSARTARTVRNRNGNLSITDGPFAETKECLGGFTIIDARDLNEVGDRVLTPG
jgi:hypothetical protein